MKLYLVRHGAALSKDEHPQRPLSEEGREQATQIALALKRAGVRPNRIVHSGKPRAQQTAEILGTQLDCNDRAPEPEWLSPNADPTLVRGQLEGKAGAWILVGHLPHLGRLSSLLLTDDSERSLLTLAAAACVCLERHGSGWVQTGLLAPVFLPSSGS